MIAEHFAAKLAVVRRRAGMTQKALASRASIHPTWISHLESGRVNPNLSTSPPPSTWSRTISLPETTSDRGALCRHLTQARKLSGLSQEELGVRASLHRTEISQLERGLRLARIDTLIKLAGGLGVDPGVLLAGIDWTPGATTPGRFELPDPAGSL